MRNKPVSEAVPHQGHSRWVYFLPTLHLCASFISIVGYVVPKLQYLGIIMPFILILDLPVSIVVYALAWKHSALAWAWILIAGTLWWYLLSRGLELVFDKFMHRH